MPAHCFEFYRYAFFALKQTKNADCVDFIDIFKRIKSVEVLKEKE